MADDKDIEYWITTDNGVHIPIKRGQSKEQAVSEFLKEKGDARGKSVEELKKDLTTSDANGKVLPIKASTFAGKNSRESHAKHITEVGAKNFKEYEKKAREFINSSKGETYTYQDGKQRRYCRYDESTGEYGVCRGDGKIVTYYRVRDRYYVAKWVKEHRGHKL